ncbi:hypothetical protein IEQ34_018597 [Dendrobium chrysotoxum]|uniref:Carbohydrate kinase PfkB domain-containing protein n=1 Tax=Dendrobium chrysotoxum TaxID=161865 RepID=A0AAV7G6B8_DENCH|nr:hypothetical protein IEQ34_018597 [Dendrobium chrysotoxum]
MAEAAISEAHGLFSSDLPPLPENRIVVGFGMVSVDYVAIVDAFPKPDEKVRGRSLQVFGGGNAANALTCASRLGLTPKLITKVGDDSLGQSALAELEADGVDTSLVKISDGGTSTSTYVIVDKQMKTRTCIYTLGVPAMVPDDLPKTKLLSALNEAKLAYFDGRSTKPALVVAQEEIENKRAINTILDSIDVDRYEVDSDDDNIDILRSPFFDVGFDFDNTVEEYFDRIHITLVDTIDDQRKKGRWTILGRLTTVSPPDTSPLRRRKLLNRSVVTKAITKLLPVQAARMSIPILVEAERKKAGLGSLLDLATYIICSEKFPQAWTSVSSIPKALVSILLKYPNVKFVIATLGEKGCLMIDRRTRGEDPHLDAIDVDSLTESLKLRIDENVTTPTFVASESSVRLRANGIGTLYGKLLLGTAEKIPPSEILDTTGAGDAFIGAVLYALCAGMPPEKMLPFSCQVAAICCRALGARTGLPQRDDPRLAPFLR